MAIRTEWKIGRKSPSCGGCGKAFPHETPFHSAIWLEADGFRRRDLCERLTRGGLRTLERLAAGSLGDGPDVSGWWPDGRPSAREVAAVARWSSGPTPRALREGLAWTRPGEGARAIGRVTSSDPRR